LIVTVTPSAAAAGVAPPGEEFAPPPQPANMSGKASTRMGKPRVDEQRRVGI
jgi:hypothetical protein